MTDEYQPQLALDRLDDPTTSPSRSTRRDAVKAGAAVVGGVVAASYVKPSLNGLGIPAALAWSGTGPKKPKISCTPTRCEKNKNTQFSCSGSGYSPYEQVKICFNGFPWNWYATCDGNGSFSSNFSCSFQSAGTYTCTASSYSGGRGGYRSRSMLVASTTTVSESASATVTAV